MPEAPLRSTIKVRFEAEFDNSTLVGEDPRPWYRSPSVPRAALQKSGHSRKFRNGLSTHFSHHRAPVHFHSRLLNAQLGCDLFVEIPGDHKRENGAFSRRQRGHTGPNFEKIVVAHARRTGHAESDGNRVQ